jgi:hypothetical protein
MFAYAFSRSLSSTAVRRIDASLSFQPADRFREGHAPGDLDQLQQIALFPALVTDKACVPNDQVRRFSPLRLT